MFVRLPWGGGCFSLLLGNGERRVTLRVRIVPAVRVLCPTCRVSACSGAAFQQAGRRLGWAPMRHTLWAALWRAFLGKSGLALRSSWPQARKPS